MILPIGDAPNARGPAPVTYLLLAANIAVFVLVSLPLSLEPPDLRDPDLRAYLEVAYEATRGQASPQQLLQQTTEYDLFLFRHGYRPAKPSMADLAACMFLHGGFLHLAGNMLFLWIYGDNVEKQMGSLRYLLAYLGTGSAATLFHSLFSPGSDLPVVGASGAISGVLGFYALWFPRNIVRLLFVLPPFLMQVFEVPARLVLGMYLVVDNLLPFLVTRDGGGVAHGAHIGGFVAGFAVAWALRRREIGPARLAERQPVPSARDAVERALRLREAGRSDEALSVLRQAVRDIPSGPGLADVYALAGLILFEDRDAPAAAYQYLLTALDLDPDPGTAAVVRSTLRRIDELQARNVGRLHSPHPW